MAHLSNNRDHYSRPDGINWGLIICLIGCAIFWTLLFWIILH